MVLVFRARDTGQLIAKWEPSQNKHLFICFSFLVATCMAIVLVLLSLKFGIYKSMFDNSCRSMFSDAYKCPTSTSIALRKLSKSQKSALASRLILSRILFGNLSKSIAVVILILANDLRNWNEICSILQTLQRVVLYPGM